MSLVFKPRALALVIVLLVSVAAVGASAQAATRPRPPIVSRTTPVTGGSTYLSLGDSVTFGYMEPGVVPAPDYHNPASFLGYPEQLGAQLHLRVVNPACPGETSASLINASALSNGCENAYRKAYPLHVRYAGSQLAYAVAFLRRNRNVRLVSLMIGANDLFICQRTTSDSCLKASEQNALFAQVSANVRRILSAVRNQAGYRGQLAIVNYYSLDYSSSVINTVTSGLNRAVDTAARPFGVEVTGSFGLFQTASARSAGSTCIAGLLTQLGKPGTCGVHPSYAGSALLAQSLLETIRL